MSGTRKSRSLEPLFRFSDLSTLNHPLSTAGPLARLTQNPLCAPAETLYR